MRQRDAGECAVVEGRLRHGCSPSPAEEPILIKGEYLYRISIRE
jgi:hypothetical protein